LVDKTAENLLTLYASSFSATAVSEAKGTGSFCGQIKGKGSLELFHN